MILHFSSICDVEVNALEVILTQYFLLLIAGDSVMLSHPLTSLILALSTGDFPSQLCPLEEIYSDQQRVSLMK